MGINERRSNLLFAVLMAVLLTLPVLGFLSGPARSATFHHQFNAETPTPQSSPTGTLGVR